MTWTPSDALVEKAARAMCMARYGIDEMYPEHARIVQAILIACRDDMVAEAVRADTDLYRMFHDAWVEHEVSRATGDPDGAAEKRNALVNIHHSIRARHP